MRWLPLLVLLTACYRPDRAFLEDPAARERFARSAESALRGEREGWLRARLVSPDPALDAELRQGDAATGWVEEWIGAHATWGMARFLREELPEGGAPVLWFRNFDGERPVYLRLELGQGRLPGGPPGRDSLVITDWTEYPGALGARERWRAMDRLRAATGPETLAATVQALVAASRAAEAGRADLALATLDDLPDAARANPLVVAERLRVLSESGHPDFASEAIGSGAVLDAPALAHLAFTWSLTHRDANGLRRATGDLERQFGADRLLDFYRGLAAEWQGDCGAADSAFARTRAAFPALPLLPWSGLNCLAQASPDSAVARLEALTAGSGLPLDELDAWVAQTVPALHRTRVWHDWRLAAPDTLR